MRALRSAVTSTLGPLKAGKKLVWLVVTLSPPRNFVDYGHGGERSNQPLKLQDIYPCWYSA